MIRLLLNRYTEREKLLLVEALREAVCYLAQRTRLQDDAPHLLDDLQAAILFASSEHVHDVVARTLGIDTHTVDLDAELARCDAALARELAKCDADELREQWGIE